MKYILLLLTTVALLSMKLSPELRILPPVRNRTNALAEGLTRELPLCLTGVKKLGYSVATRIVIPEILASSASDAQIGPCPRNTVAIWHNHPFDRRLAEDNQGMCYLSLPDVYAAHWVRDRRERFPLLEFLVVQVDRDTLCWWHLSQTEFKALEFIKLEALERPEPRILPLPEQRSY